MPKLVSTLLVVLALPVMLFGQAKKPVDAPIQPAPQQITNVAVPAEQALAIVKLQRDMQDLELTAKAAQEQAQQKLQALVTQYNKAVEKARTDLKVPADAPFNAEMVSFAIPKSSEKSAETAKPAAENK